MVAQRKRRRGSCSLFVLGSRLRSRRGWRSCLCEGRVCDAEVAHSSKGARRPLGGRPRRGPRPESLWGGGVRRGRDAKLERLLRESHATRAVGSRGGEVAEAPVHHLKAKRRFFLKRRQGKARRRAWSTAMMRGASRGVFGTKGGCLAAVEERASEEGRCVSCVHWRRRRRRRRSTREFFSFGKFCEKRCVLIRCAAASSYSLASCRFGSRGRR
mmetsp:Transcript_2889/g.8722  ORF Transcript_2889/g.8722 Transcript_2889/m.8722 type:complete len:214 (+) Transcript_2889:188-829(+)